MRHSVGDSKHNPGNANSAPSRGFSGMNLPIGVVKAGEKPKSAIQKNGAPRWHSRGYLPHFESAEVTQHVTFHLADGLPQTVLQQLESELKFLPADKQDAERRKRIDAWIDAGHGSCALRKPAIADMVRDRCWPLIQSVTGCWHGWLCQTTCMCFSNRSTDGRSQRSWLRGRSSRPARSANIAAMALPVQAIPSGTASIGTAISATKTTWRKRLSTFISIP